MGEVYGLAALALAMAGAGWLATVALINSRSPKKNGGGTWRRAHETNSEGGNTIVRVLLVREREGRETGRLVIRELDIRDPNWDELYTEAIVKADMHLARLESAERH